MKPETARLQAIDWAKKLNNRPFVILDFETTDKYPEKAEPVQVAITSSSGLKTLFKSYIKPVGQMSPEAQQITGITPDMLKNAPSWADVYPDVEMYLKGKTVVIYNAAYDSKVLECTNERHNMPQIPGIKFECAMLPFADFYGDWNVHPHYGGSFRWKSLSVAAQTFGLSSDGAHDAEADCKMTAKVIMSMANVDMSQPQVFEFEKDTFTILMPGKSPHTLIDRTEGARARILAKISQPDTTPVQAVETPETASGEEIPAPETELTPFETELERFARDWAKVEALKVELNLEEREKDIRKKALAYARANGVSPHTAILTSKQPKWLKFDEIELLMLAREHMPSLIEERINAAMLKEAYESLVEMGLMDWAFGAIQRNDDPVIKLSTPGLYALASKEESHAG